MTKPKLKKKPKSITQMFGWSAFPKSRKMQDPISIDKDTFYEALAAFELGLRKLRAAKERVNPSVTKK